MAARVVLEPGNQIVHDSQIKTSIDKAIHIQYNYYFDLVVIFMPVDHRFF